MSLAEAELNGSTLASKVARYRWNVLGTAAARSRVRTGEAGSTEASGGDLLPSSCTQGVLRQGEALRGGLSTSTGLWWSEQGSAMVVRGHCEHGGHGMVTSAFSNAGDSIWPVRSIRVCASVWRVKEPKAQLVVIPGWENALASMAMEIVASRERQRGESLPCCR